MERALNSEGKSLTDLKNLHHFYKQESVRGAIVSINWRKFTVKVRLAKGKFPRISLVKGEKK